MRKPVYFVHQSRIYHPTWRGSTIPNQSTTNQTYVDERKMNPSDLYYSSDYANAQNTEDENNRRRYFFTPSFRN